jgi:hypothetical protein
MDRIYYLRSQGRGRKGKTRLAASDRVVLRARREPDVMRKDSRVQYLVRRLIEVGYRELRAQGYDLQPPSGPLCEGDSPGPWSVALRQPTMGPAASGQKRPTM